MCRWALCACLCLLATQAIDLPTCKDQKIYILDLNDFVSGNVPPCSLEDIAVVNPSNGVVYTPEAKLKERVSHKYGSHAGPWYVMEALKTSGLVTYNIEEADVVFVNSYCYYEWWLGWTNSRGRTQQQSPAEYLIAGFEGMVASPRWKRHDGKDFVFYDPHPGLVSGPAGKQYWSYVCNNFRKSMHIVAERGQRNVCPTYWDMADRLLVAPYVANVGSGGQYQAWESALKPVQDRKNLLFSRFRCTPYRVDNFGVVINVGKKMRHDIVKALQYSGDDVVVKCTDAEFGGEGESFDQMLAEMQNSKYCLLLPGDSASTRALSEMMMAGCIPVYVGPPYATMPLHDDVDYTALGLFFNVSNYQAWQTQTMHWELHPTERPAHSQIPWFWIPESEIYPQLISIATVSEFIPELRRVAGFGLDDMFKVMEAKRPAFVFYNHLTPQWTAVNAIISKMCSLAGGLEKPQAIVEAARLLASANPVQAGKLQQERQKRARRSHVTGVAAHLRGSHIMKFPE